MINHPILLEVLIRDRRRQLEAIGVTKATVAVDLPMTVSFTVETDGRLPSGQPPGNAIDQGDETTDGALVYDLISGAHPSLGNVFNREAGAVSTARVLRHRP